MDTLTFKNYLDSKAKLREAIMKTPIASSSYRVKRYCKIRIGETRNNREEVALKPKQTIIVEWRYDDIDNPEPNSIILESVDSGSKPVYWSGQKLKSWLSKNAIEEL